MSSSLTQQADEYARSGAWIQEPLERKNFSLVTHDIPGNVPSKFKKHQFYYKQAEGMYPHARLGAGGKTYRADSNFQSRQSNPYLQKTASHILNGQQDMTSSQMQNTTEQRGGLTDNKGLFSSQNEENSRHIREQYEDSSKVNSTLRYYDRDFQPSYQKPYKPPQDDYDESYREQYRIYSGQDPYNPEYPKHHQYKKSYEETLQNHTDSQAEAKTETDNPAVKEKAGRPVASYETSANNGSSASYLVKNMPPHRPERVMSADKSAEEYKHRPDPDDTRFQYVLKKEYENREQGPRIDYANYPYVYPPGLIDIPDHLSYIPDRRDEKFREENAYGKFQWYVPKNMDFKFLQKPILRLPQVRGDYLISEYENSFRQYTALSPEEQRRRRQEFYAYQKAIREEHEKLISQQKAEGGKLPPPLPNFRIPSSTGPYNQGPQMTQSMGPAQFQNNRDQEAKPKYSQPPQYDAPRQYEQNPQEAPSAQQSTSQQPSYSRRAPNLNNQGGSRQTQQPQQDQGSSGQGMMTQSMLVNPTHSLRDTILPERLPSALTTKVSNNEYTINRAHTRGEGKPMVFNNYDEIPLDMLDDSRWHVTRGPDGRFHVYDMSRWNNRILYDNGRVTDDMARPIEDDFAKLKQLDREFSRYMIRDGMDRKEASLQSSKLPPARDYCREEIFPR